MLPVPLPVPFRLLPERRCFANVGFEKCYLLHPPAPAARMGTPSLPPPIAAIQNWWSWKAPPLLGALRDPYGTLTGPLENYFRNSWQSAMTAVSLRELIMVRESWLIQCDFDVGVAFRPRFRYPSGTFRYTCLFSPCPKNKSNFI